MELLSWISVLLIEVGGLLKRERLLQDQVL